MTDLHQTISQIISHVPEEATELIDDLKHCQTSHDICQVLVDHQVTTDGEEWEATVIDIFYGGLMTINRLENIRRAISLTEELEKIIKDEVDDRNHWGLIDHMESARLYFRRELQELEKEKMQQLKRQPQ